LYGVKGIAFVGAMKVLDKEEILQNINRVGGTSAGSINAVLFAAGFSNPETLNVLNKVDFNNFKDDSQHLHDDDWHRTIYIDTLGVGTTDFDLSSSRKKELVDSGEKAANNYLKWWSDVSKDLAINHPSSKK
jgi:hypothetical protein